MVARASTCLVRPHVSLLQNVPILLRPFPISPSLPIPLYKAPISAFDPPQQAVHSRFCSSLSVDCYGCSVYLARTCPTPFSSAFRASLAPEAAPAFDSSISIAFLPSPALGVGLRGAAEQRDILLHRRARQQGR